MVLPMPLWGDFSGPGAVEGTSAEHDGVSHVAATSCETDDCGVVLLLFGTLALVGRSQVRIAMPSNPGSTEQGVLELLVARAGGVLYADLLAGSAGDEGRCRRRRPGEPQPKRLGKLLIKPLSPAE